MNVDFLIRDLHRQLAILERDIRRMNEKGDASPLLKGIRQGILQAIETIQKHAAQPKHANDHSHCRCYVRKKKAKNT